MCSYADSVCLAILIILLWCGFFGFMFYWLEKAGLVTWKND